MDSTCDGVSGIPVIWIIDPQSPGKTLMLLKWQAVEKRDDRLSIVDPRSLLGQGPFGLGVALRT
jgi:hypothetical protein